MLMMGVFFDHGLAFLMGLGFRMAYGGRCGFEGLPIGFHQRLDLFHFYTSHEVMIVLNRMACWQ